MQSKQKFALQRFRVLKPRPRVTPIVLFLKSCCCVREKNIFLSYLRQIISWKIPQRCYPPNPPKKTHTHARRISLPLSPRQLSFYTIHGPKSNALHFSRKEINMSVAPISCLYFDVNIRDISHVLCRKSTSRRVHTGIFC